MIVIDAQLREAAPHLTLGIIAADGVVVEQRNEVLWNDLTAAGQKISERYPTRLQLRQDPNIAALDGVYRVLGTDPRRYPGSAEALALRVMPSGRQRPKGLYQVNSAVDLNNLISLQTLCSVGVYDLLRLTLPLVFRVGQTGESYAGIGKERVGLCNLPVFADAHGPYGSPTADSNRAMITLNTVRLLFVIISFGSRPELDEDVKRVTALIQRYMSIGSNQIATHVV